MVDFDEVKVERKSGSMSTNWGSFGFAIFLSATYSFTTDMRS